MADNELVQVRGRFVGVESTGKCHNSYVFEFRTSHRLHGPGRPPTPDDRLVEFELYMDRGGSALLAQLGGAMEDPRPFDEVVRALPDAPTFDVVLWLLSSAGECGVGWYHEVYLVGAPVPIRY